MTNVKKKFIVNSKIIKFTNKNEKLMKNYFHNEWKKK